MSAHLISRRRIVTGVASIMPVGAVSLLVPSVANADDELHQSRHVGADIAALHELQSRFHESISGGGHIDELVSLWADDATFIAGGSTLHGKDEIRSFFLQGGGFTHNWVSVSPAWKTRFQVHGNTADIYFECHFVDWQANPQVVLTHGTFEGTAGKVDGRWLFRHITAGVNPLTP